MKRRIESEGAQALRKLSPSADETDVIQSGPIAGHDRRALVHALHQAFDETLGRMAEYVRHGSGGAHVDTKYLLAR